MKRKHTPHTNAYSYITPLERLEAFCCLQTARIQRTLQTRAEQVPGIYLHPHLDTVVNKYTLMREGDMEVRK